MHPSRRPEECLRGLDGRSLDGFTITLRNIHRPRGRESECRYFELYVKGSDEAISRDPVVYGLFSSGRPSIALRSYFDIGFDYKPRFEGKLGVSRRLDISRNGLDLQVFKALSELVEPGGKIIVAVAAPKWLELINESFTCLNLGFPPETTYLGHLLFACGCGSFFKSWLIREGGCEGPPAIQGEKAYGQEDYSRGIVESALRLMKFLDELPVKTGLYKVAGERAMSILRGIRVGDKDIQRLIEEAVKKHSG